MIDGAPKREPFDLPDALHEGALRAEAELVSTVLTAPLLYRHAARRVSSDRFADQTMGLLFEHVGDMLREGVIVTAAEDVAFWLIYSDRSKWPDSDEEKTRREIDALQRRRVCFTGSDLPRHVAYLADVIQQRTDAKPGPVDATGVQLLTAADVIRSKSFARPRRTFSTGIPQLDEILGGGLKSRQQSVIGAPTGVGKTSLVGTVALFLARTGYPVLWVATELDAEEQAARFASIALREQSRAHATADALLSHALPIDDVAAALDGLNVYVIRVRRRDGDPFATMLAQSQAIREACGQAPIIVCDYMQKLAVNDADSRRTSVSDVSERLLDLAQSLDTHVIAISSVARAFYNSTAKRLRKQRTDAEDPGEWLAMGKESGEIEYDGAVVAYLDVADAASALDERFARLVVAKNRNGRTGFAGLRFHGPSGLFLPAPEAVGVLAPETAPPDDERVFEYIRKHPRQTPKAIRESVRGLAKSKIDVSIERLLDAGRLERVEEEQSNARGQLRKRTLLVVRQRTEVDNDE